MTEPPANPQDHIEQTVQSLADVHEAQAREVGVVQDLANRVTALLGRPAAVMALVLLVVAWMVFNSVAHGAAPDPFPFVRLELAGTVSALLVTLLILTTQRHEQQVARRREQLTLHMAVLTETKVAKLIALIEEQRRDSSVLPSREDKEAETMAQPSDPANSLDSIERSVLSDSA